MDCFCLTQRATFSYLLNSNETERWLRFSLRDFRSDCGAHSDCGCGKSMLTIEKRMFSPEKKQIYGRAVISNFVFIHLITRATSFP